MARNAKETRQGILDSAEALIMEQGFAATSVDSIVANAGLTKGAFFHHFATKGSLALALVERYAEADERQLHDALERAERLSRDPAEQLLLFVGILEEAWRDRAELAVGCLFASYVYEAQLFDEHTHAVIRRSVHQWRDTLSGKLRAALERYPPVIPVDPEVVADMITVIFEGAFILARSLGSPDIVAKQLGQYRNYLELLFGRA